MRILLCVCTASLLMLGGCRSDRSAAEVEILSVSPTHGGIARATEEAQRTLEGFIRKLERKEPGASYAVKNAFATADGGYEHMWVTGQTYSGGSFYGRLDNSPTKTISVKEGDLVRVAKQDVTDWMIFQQGRPMEGGFSVSVLSPHTSKKLQERQSSR